MAEGNEDLKRYGAMFLCAVAGYGLAQYQNNRRSQGQICYAPVTDTHSLPDFLASKAEEVIRAGGQVGIRKVGALLELVVQNATGDTEIFREALNQARQANAAYSAPEQPTMDKSASYAEEPITVEMFDKATGTWQTVKA
jgi:hypothetical protein